MTSVLDASARPPWQDHFPPLSYWVKLAAIAIAMVMTILAIGVLDDILVLLAAAFVFAVGLQPAIGWFEDRRMPRWLGLGVILVGGFVATVLVVALTLPVAVDQLSAFVQELPDRLRELQARDDLVGELASRLDLDRPDAVLDGQDASATDGVMAVLRGLGGAAFKLSVVLVLTPYFAFGMPSLKRWAVRLLVREDRERFVHVLDRATHVMASYIAGNLLVSVIAGAYAYAALRVVGVPYALALALIVAVTDLVPAVGATVGAAIVVAAASLVGPGEAVAMAALLFVYQQVENYWIVPRVMKQAIDVHPATAIVALLVGGALAGIAGALLALPLTAMLTLLLRESWVRDRMRRVREHELDVDEPAGSRLRRWDELRTGPRVERARLP